MAERVEKTLKKQRLPDPAAAAAQAEAAAAAPRVLALQRSAGNRATAQLLRQPQVRERPRVAEQPVRPVPPAQPQPVPRRDYVFLMGAVEARGSRNPFYRMALRYWRAHCPNATFVLDKRNMHDLLAYIRDNVQAPIGRLIIVSHANEDGTLSFGLNSSDRGGRLDVRELDSALHPRVGATALPRLGNQIDAQTRIHIKGCDIGRTQQMVELVDESFGGLGVVTAPTHEQEYGYDPVLEQRAIDAARAGVEARHPVPEAVDASLRGRERTRAIRARAAAVRARQQAIRAELAQIGEQAGSYEAFSGPMLQRPGTQQFTQRELEAEVNRLYGHLSETQRAAMVRQLLAADPRASALAHRQGTFEQHGQRAYRFTPNVFRFNEPRTVREVTALFGAQFRRQGFRPTGVRRRRDPVADGFQIVTDVDGTVQRRGQDPFDTTLTFTSGTIPDDATMIRQGREQFPNPDRYRWTLEEANAGGRATRTVVAERVVAYLHHGELDPGPHQHFTRPLSDPNFFATSRFAPRPPARPRP
jgi:hypothetical protein